MNLREIADAIEQTKAGYFAEIVGDVDKAKSEVWEIAHGFGFRYGVLIRFPSRGDAGEVRCERFHERASRRL